jgi:hypothetical protein
VPEFYQEKYNPPSISLIIRSLICFDDAGNTEWPDLIDYHQQTWDFIPKPIGKLVPG